MRGMLELPPFSVVVWVKKTDDFPSIRTELMNIAEEEPYESAEDQGLIDFHWGFAEQKDAERFAASLQAITEKPEVLLLRASSIDGPLITIKDTRRRSH
jgi:hypothetical protein